MIRSKNMYEDGQYLKNNPSWDVEDARWKSDAIKGLLEKNSIQPKSLIEVGCGAGAILENLAAQLPFIQSFQGFDISPQAISLAKQRETATIRFFNEDFLLRKDLHTDLLLLIDVLEHLEDYYGFLQKIRMDSNFFVFHIPLDLSCRTILKPHVLYQQRESVGHIHYFSEEMILWMLQDTGFEIIDFVYTKPEVDLIQADSVKRWIKKGLRNFSFGISKKISAKLWGGYSMMILAK
jgi:predicted TPR repeat methyltransferase